jgi:osmotically inducible protein OsmC
VEAKVPGATADAFEKAANGAKANCPVSKLYNTNITMNARLV